MWIVTYGDGLLAAFDKKAYAIWAVRSEHAEGRPACLKWVPKRRYRPFEVLSRQTGEYLQFIDRMAAQAYFNRSLPFRRAAV